MLTIKVDGTGARRVVQLSGECDIATAPQLHEALTGLRGEVRDLILDMSRLDFIDSSGIAVVAGALRWTRGAGGTLSVAGTRGTIRKVFEITGLDKAIPLVDVPDAG